jgi:A/G-specific adenine glycosylase
VAVSKSQRVETLICKDSHIAEFAPRLLTWFDQFGRHDLPWQHPRSPYFVWLSEIMLQQTQVASVLVYFKRFITRFPDLASLAAAPIDEVLQQWAGLGYYSRARNLHACALVCVRLHNGSLPNTQQELIALPGIGRSTAAAIVSQAFNQPAAILDGNVKRVLARQINLSVALNSSSLNQLWQAAEARLPSVQSADYSQAIMDLGASICTPRKPNCEVCPVSSLCQAFKFETVAQIPVKKVRKESPKRFAQWLIVRNDIGELLMQRRPESGIWGGLYSLPEADLKFDFERMPLPLEQLRFVKELPALKHVFTHFQLFATPHLARAKPISQLASPQLNANYLWVSPSELQQLGLPAPVKKLLAQIDAL